MVAPEEGVERVAVTRLSGGDERAVVGGGGDDRERRSAQDADFFDGDHGLSRDGGALHADCRAGHAAKEPCQYGPRSLYGIVAHRRILALFEQIMVVIGFLFSTRYNRRPLKENSE